MAVKHSTLPTEEHLENCIAEQSPPVAPSLPESGSITTEKNSIADIPNIAIDGSESKCDVENLQAGAESRANSQDLRTVVNCYDFVDRLFPECGLLDLTEGIYHDDPTVTYEQAQQNQLHWLLDQVHCQTGSRILDVGCGNGTLLEAARERGAIAVGITISPHQVKRCQQRGLDARLLNYCDIDESWNGTFDAVVANGSLEHFVQPQDAILGRQDAIYQNFFQICGRLLDAHSPSRRLATTAIHFDRFRPRPQDLIRSPLVFRPFSDRFHIALLERAMGGYYPVDDQLARCAAPGFQLVREVDGTGDYHRTSEQWLSRVYRYLLDPRNVPRILRRFVPYSLHHPCHTAMSLLLIIAQSWQWQFRGNHPPMKLLQQVWQHSQ